jgi:hypothetical protein
MRQASTQKLLNQLSAIDARSKALYAKRDGLETRLLEAIQAAGGSLPLPGDRSVRLKDNFIDPKTGSPRNVAFKAAAIKRFEFTIV